MKKKVLWFGGVLSDGHRRSTGTWLDSMSQALANSGTITLCNIAVAPVKHSVRRDVGAVQQWLIPSAAVSKSTGLPPKHIIDEIIAKVDVFSPDLIHVWGVEGFAGLVTARKLVNYPALLEMQGLKGAIAKYYAGGLSLSEQRKCRGLKEILKRRFISSEARRFEKWGEFEREMIRGHKFIATQTDWIESQVKATNPTCKTFHSYRSILLQSDYYQLPSWRYHGKPIIFCSAAYSAPFKGLHVAVRATALLKRTFPDVELRIAGDHSMHGLKRDGYIAWVVAEARAAGVEDNVTWLGPLDSTAICKEIQNAAAMVIPSFIENCSTSMQEAMMLGAPVVASYAGGMPSLARDEESALFFPPGDEAMCARNLERLIVDETLATRIGGKARATASVRNNPVMVLAHQISTYQSMLDSVSLS